MKSVALDGTRPVEGLRGRETNPGRLGSHSPRPDRARRPRDAEPTPAEAAPGHDQRAPRDAGSLTRHDRPEADPSSARPVGSGVYHGGYLAGQSLCTSSSVLDSDAGRTVSSVAVCSRGVHVAWGDRAGRMYVACRSGVDRGEAPSAGGSLCVLEQSEVYPPFVDPLCSTDVAQAVTDIAFIPQVSPTLQFLTTNARIPKFWKLTQAASLTPAFRAVDMLSSRQVGPLTVPTRSAVYCREAAKYNIDHECDIHSVCPTADGQHFYTADELVIRHWATDVTHMSLEMLNLSPGGDRDSVDDVLTRLRGSPTDPHLLLCTTSRGLVKVFDTRTALRVSADPASTCGPALTLRNPHRDADGDYAALTRSLSDCTVTPCGRYLLGRDFMSVAMWDLRGGTAPAPRSPTSSAGQDLLRRWVLHPPLLPLLPELYEAQTLFDKFTIATTHHGTRWVTGSFYGSVCVGSTTDDAATVDVTGTEAEAPYDVVGKPGYSARRVELPTTDTLRSRAVGPKSVLAATAVSGEGGDVGRRAVFTAAAPGPAGDVFVAVDDVVHNVSLT